jgi:hypothetical protein
MTPLGFYFSWTTSTPFNGTGYDLLFPGSLMPFFRLGGNYLISDNCVNMIDVTSLLRLFLFLFFFLNIFF